MTQALRASAWWLQQHLTWQQVGSNSAGSIAKLGHALLVLSTSAVQQLRSALCSRVGHW
jgi:hypothetical protein